MFPTIAVAGSGLSVDETWINTIGGNVANSQDAVTPGQPVYRPQYLEIAAQPPAGPLPVAPPVGTGVQVKQVVLGSAKGVTVADPSSPLAKNGLVTMPDVNIGHELVSLVEAQTNYQADADVLQKADLAYTAILNIKP